MLGADDAEGAVGFGAGVGHVVALAVEGRDEHGAAMHLATRLLGADLRDVVAFGRSVTDSFAKAAAAEFFGATEEINGIVGAVGGEDQFHGAVMAVTEGEDVHPHAKPSVASGLGWQRWAGGKTGRNLASRPRTPSIPHRRN